MIVIVAIPLNLVLPFHPSSANLSKSVGFLPQLPPKRKHEQLLSIALHKTEGNNWEQWRSAFPKSTAKNHSRWVRAIANEVWLIFAVIMAFPARPIIHLSRAITFAFSAALTHLFSGPETLTCCSPESFQCVGIHRNQNRNGSRPGTSIVSCRLKLARSGFLTSIFSWIQNRSWLFLITRKGEPKFQKFCQKNKRQ